MMGIRKHKPTPDTPSLFGDNLPPPKAKASASATGTAARKAAGKDSGGTAAGSTAQAPSSEYIDRNRDRIRRWSSKGVLFGSSSWKYPGWKGQVYNRAYPSQKVFEREGLSEYSELFPTVSADFAL